MKNFEKWYFRGITVFFGLVVFVPLAYFGYRELAPNPLVGECVKRVDHGAADLTFDEVNCTKPGRRSGGTGKEFEVGAIASTCPPGDYTAVPRGDKKTCYLPVSSTGSCFVAEQFRNTSKPVLVRGDCKKPGARKSESHIKDVNDKSRCANKELSVTFSEPPTTICMVKP